MCKSKEVERSLIKTYRKDIYARFVALIKEYNLIKPSDKLYMIIDGTRASFLCAKLLQELKAHSSIKCEVEFYYNDLNLREILAFLNIEANETNNENNIAKDMKKVVFDTYDDVIEETLGSILNEGVYKTLLPIEKRDGRIIIRPLYFIKDIDIIRWKNYNHLSFIDDNYIKNKKTKELIKYLRINYNKQVEDNIFISSTNVNLDKLLGYVKNGKNISYLERYEDIKE